MTVFCTLVLTYKMSGIVTKIDLVACLNSKTSSSFPLIYKFQCSNCNITYYSETERHLKVRAGEHIATFPLTGKRVNKNKISAVNTSLSFVRSCAFL